jgi:A/G-specific adenine glycosylase
MPPSRATADILLSWYDRHARRLPWRTPPGGPLPDPYGVWLSEVMLQQTTVAAVIPYYQRFLNRWPTVADLAAAPQDDVLTEWAGLGYYARARNLHKCAQVVAADHGGSFPDTEDGLLALPGIGAYTAAAVAAIAFGRPATVVDGNVERVMARLFSVTEPLPDSKAELKRLAATLTPSERAGDYAQAVMDLGATVCTPRSPSCLDCPWRAPCTARQEGIQDQLPKKRRKSAKPIRRGVAFWVIDTSGRALLRKRPETGLLGGMTEVPSTPWIEDAAWTPDDALTHAPVMADDWRPLPGLVRHTFTHFHLELAVMAAALDRPGPDNAGRWVDVTEMGGQALPTVMRKVVKHGLAGALD